ncbi:hypothetical protein [Kitasatospora sp. NPDC059571]|uniref:hypothetical protein n=1 Tax=Kitasatospora sp. NPDC059571 TaxID=3346871 RepID=UPI00369275A7
MTEHEPLTADGRMLLALAARREAEVRRLRAERSADPAARARRAAVTAEALRLAVQRMFGRPAPPWRMVRFAARRRSDVAGRPYSAATAYSVTSWAAGDTAAIARIPEDEVQAYALRLFVAIADELRLTEAELTGLVAAAERSAGPP